MKMKLLKNLLCISPIVFAVILNGCTSTTKQESTGQYIDSSSITTQVKSKLLADPNISSLPITVNTYKNQVQLSGFVKSRQQAFQAERIARSVSGVQTVKNDLVVR